MGVDGGKKSGTIVEREREKKMKIAKYPTVRRNLAKYAKKAGLVCVKNDAGGTFSIWDTKMKYYTNQFITADHAARVILDELHMMSYSPNNGG